MDFKVFAVILGILVISNFEMSTANSIPSRENAKNIVSAGLNQFATSFYQTSAKTTNDNLICSPLSAGVVLAMTAQGARGNTGLQMRTSIGIPEDDEITKTGYQSLIDTLNDAKKVTLKLAQKIFTADGFEVKPEFKEATETYFRSAAQSVDFNKPAEASQTINAWCEEKTNNRIKDVLKPDDVNGAAMVLVNAVYFKGNWVSKFLAYNTMTRPFHVDDKTTKDVDTMYQEHQFNYGTLPDLDAVFVELPYEHENEDDAISMFIILPNQVNGLKKSSDNLSTVNFKQLHNDRQMTMMRLFMPKFKIESTLELKPILMEMGMSDMFGDNADFTGITDAPPLKISKAIQKAFIEVNEEGSEAAAVTAVIGMARTAMYLRPEPIVVKIDRPFMYAIVHNSANAILFQGHIVMPTI